MKYHVEYTDTFGEKFCGNYCWVHRREIKVPDNASRKLIMRRAKAAMGLSGIRGEVADFGDEYWFSPYNSATVMFVTLSDD